MKAKLILAPLAFTLASLSLASCQAKVAAHVPRELKDCAECPPMVLIPEMPGAESQIAIARHELTWKEYIAAVTQANCPLPKPVREANGSVDLDALSDSYPINYLTVSEFSCYLEWISQKTGFAYRLPTGAEWEFAARAGATTRFPWGDEPGFNRMALNPHDAIAPFGETGWFDRGFVRRGNPDPLDPRLAIGKDRDLYPVESFPPNSWGLYDVVGNVAEFTSDTKPGPQKCVARSGARMCTGRAERGGGGHSIGISDGKVVGLDTRYLSETTWRLQEFPQPTGYRVVRDSS